MTKTFISIYNVFKAYLNTNTQNTKGVNMKDKFKEIVLYIAQKSKDDPTFGSTKLNKILFISDFTYYGLTGKSITGAEYWHLQNGPTPKQMIKTLNELESRGDIIIKKTDYFGYTQKRIIPKRKADTVIFADDEIDFINQTIKFFNAKNGTELSNWTHTLTPWLITQNREPIPYEAVFMLHQLPVEKDGLVWAESELKRLEESGEYVC